MPENRHILVVEDEEHLAVGIKFNLEAEGYRVTTTEEGPKALEIINAEGCDVDLILLDIMLPGMSGYTVCESIRQAGNDLPILLLSARTLPEDRTRGFDAGANQYLTKPFELDELLSRVKNLLLQHRRVAAVTVSEDTDRLQFGATSVDFATHEVTVDATPIRMTKLELDLLRYFAKNEGRVISREELLTNVWKMPATMNTRAPDQFIRRLRKSLEPDPAKPRHFLTVRDAGYRFISGNP